MLDFGDRTRAGTFRHGTAVDRGVRVGTIVIPLQEAIQYTTDTHGFLPIQNPCMCITHVIKRYFLFGLRKDAESWSLVLRGVMPVSNSHACPDVCTQQSGSVKGYVVSRSMNRNVLFLSPLLLHATLFCILRPFVLFIRSIVVSTYALCLN